MNVHKNRKVKKHPISIRIGVYSALSLLLLITLSTITRCGKMYEVKERELRIRYVNLGIVFEFMINQNYEARNLKNQKNELLTRIKNTEGEILREGDGVKGVTLKKNLKRFKIELGKIREKEHYYKGKFLNDINNAISILAKDMQIDFVLNMGDALIFSQKEYDITEDVIREIIKLKKRRDPVSR
jgi:Skp family chaperone for outer membrane proteins